LFSAIPVRPVFIFVVRVLKVDLPKAKIAVQQLTGDEDEAKDLNDALPWLIQNTWSLSFLLAVASFFSLIFLEVDHPGSHVGIYIHGPIFRMGEYVGSLFSRDAATHDLFGVGADFLFLMLFWFTVIWWIKQLRAERQDSTTQNNS
jgi:hypothetical protein